MKFLIAALMIVASLNSMADEIEYNCEGKNISVQVMSVYGANFNQYLLIKNKTLLKKNETKVPLQFSVSLDPKWTTSSVAIKDEAIEEKANLIVGKGGHYLKIGAPIKGSEKAPSTFNSPAIKNGKTVELVCEQLIFG